MRQWLTRVHAFMFSWRHLWSEEIIALLLVLFIFAVPGTGALRLQERSVFIANNEPGEVSPYTVSFRYMSPTIVGSVDMLFCVDPIPYHPCVAPTGIDVSNVSLGTQTGEGNYSILSKTSNRITLTRPPTGITTTGGSSYELLNIKNPTDSSQAFSIRLATYATPNATGSLIDFGSVRTQVSHGVEIITQVPPMLIFCVAEEVAEDCVSTNDNYYTDMGQLSPQSTLTARSQMAVGTNASGGFAITANGTPLSAGTSVVDSPALPTESKQGINQFGINLVDNSAPDVGNDPEGTWANAIPSPDYSVPNRYKYVPGDVVAYSLNVSLMKKFTVSYIVNSKPDLRAGVYSTTITYIASGRF